MMTIPHVNVAFGDLPERLKTEDDEVPVPREILTRLLDLYILCWGFDEDWYLSTYPDIEAAVKQGLFPSGWAHFRTVGRGLTAYRGNLREAIARGETAVLYRPERERLLPWDPVGYVAGLRRLDRRRSEKYGPRPRVD